MKKPSNGKDTKNKGACPRGKRKLEYNDQKQPKLPLTGKLIYLDIKDIRLTKKLEADLKRLGSSVEKFFVKEINYLITSHPRPKQKNEDKLQSADSPAGVSTPSPFNCGPSPSPGAVETKTPNSVTRGKAILQKAQLQKKTSTIIENAEKWKVKIVSVEAALKWILKELAKLPPEDSKSNQSANTRGSKIKRLRSPMLKFESNTRQYRPVHANLGSWPFANVDTPKGTCPFDGTTVGRGERSCEERGDRIGLAQPMDNNMPASPAGIGGEDLNSGSNKTPRAEAPGKSRPSENQCGGLSGMKIVTAGDLKRRKEQKRIQERKKGYCECCQVKYDDLDKHVFQDQHKSFIREKKNYETLDHLIRTGPSTARFLQRVLLRHCTNHRTTDTSKSESDEEVLLITPGKSAAKSAAKDKKKSQQLKSPGRGRQSAVTTDVNTQRSKEHREKTKNTKDSKPDKQTRSVSKTSGSYTKAQDDQSGKVDGNKSNQSKEDTSVREVEEKKVCDLIKDKSNNVCPKVSLTKVSATLNAAIDKKNVDHSSEKRSCTSDGLDIKNHVVPVRTRNCQGVYPNMSPSRVSWAHRQSLSADEDSQSGSTNQDKASCVRMLDRPGVAKENIPEGNTSLDKQSSKDKNNKQPDCETKGDVPLAGDRIRVLRESRSRSKQGQQSPQATETSLRKEKRMRENLEDTQDKFDEVDGDYSSMTISQKSLAESQGISLHPNTESNVKCPDICSLRKVRACRSLVKTVFEVENKERGESSQQELGSSQVLDSISSRTRRQSPSKDTKCQDNEELDPSQVLDSISSRTRRQSPSKDTKCQGKDELDSSQVLDSTKSKTPSRSPVKNSKCQGKAELHSSQVINYSITTKTRSGSPIKNAKSLSKADLISDHTLDSTKTKTRSRSPIKNTKCRNKDVLEEGEVKDSVTTKARKQSPVKDRNINGRVKIDSTSRGVSTESNISGKSEKLCVGKPCEESSVQLLNSPRTRKKVINNKDEKHHSLKSNDENGSVEKRVRSHSNSKTRSEKYLSEVETSVDSEPVSPRKHLRSRESHHIAKDSQPTSSIPLKPDSSQDIRCSPSLKESNSGKSVSKKDSNADAKENFKCKNMKSSLTENMDSKPHRKVQSSTKVQIESSEEKSTATNGDLITSSAFVSETVEEGFYVNCMEMVKKRSQMRREAQKNRTNSLESPHSSSSVVSRLDGTPRKRITVTVSPVRSSKPAPADSHERQNVKSNTNTGNATSVNSPGVQGGNDFNSKVQTKTPTNTPSAESISQRSRKKSDVNLVRISSGKPASGLKDGRSENRSKGSISTNQHPDEKRRHRDLHNDSKDVSSTRKLLTPKLLHKSENFERSPSPLFNRSPKYNKDKKSHDQHHRKSSSSRVRKSVVYDPYDIRNLSPLKQGQNVLGSPRSGYSGETSRSRKKNRNWRPSQKHSSEVKSSNSKKLQKLKLPDPATAKRLFMETSQSSVTDSHLTCEKDSSKGKATRENVSEHRPEVSKGKDQQSSKRRHSARQQLELDGNVTGDKEASSVPSLDSIPIDRLHQPADDRFIAIKKLELSDLTIVEHEDCELFSKNEKQPGGTKHSKNNSAKHRKRKMSQSDSGVGSCKEKHDRGHSKKVCNSSLKWQTSAVQMSPKAKTVKLNKSWTLLSDRSMAKILQSDGDDVPFEGFQPEHATGRSLLGSEMSYVETTEVELEGNSDHEWELEHDEGVEEEGEDYIDYVNCTFTSPGKRTDSSWDETFDNYIDHQLDRSKPSDAKLNTSFNISAGHNSPRTFGSPRRHRHQQGGLTPNKRKADLEDCSDLPPEVIGLRHTPKRRKFNKIGTAGVERVDEEIEFNYCSPQKLKAVFSPQNKIGTEIVLSSSPLKCRGGLFTSTPHSARHQNKKVSVRGSSLDLPALSDSKSQTLTGSDGKVKMKSGHHKNKYTKTCSSQESDRTDSSKQSHKSKKHRHKSHQH